MRGKILASLPAFYEGDNITEDQKIYNSVRYTLLKHIGIINRMLNSLDDELPPELKQFKFDRHADVVQDVYMHYIKVLDAYRRNKPKPGKKKAKFNTYLYTALVNFAKYYVNKYAKRYNYEGFMSDDVDALEVYASDMQSSVTEMEKKAFIDRFKDVLTDEEVEFLESRMQGHDFTRAFNGKYSPEKRNNFRKSLGNRYLEYIHEANQGDFQEDR